MKRIMLILLGVFLMVGSWGSFTNANAKSHGFNQFKDMVDNINQSVKRDTGIAIIDSIQDMGAGNLKIIYNDIVSTLSSEQFQQNTGLLFLMWTKIHGRPPFSITYYIGSVRMGRAKMTSSGQLVKD